MEWKALIKFAPRNKICKLGMNSKVYIQFSTYSGGYHGWEDIVLNSNSGSLCKVLDVSELAV